MGTTPPPGHVLYETWLPDLSNPKMIAMLEQHNWNFESVLAEVEIMIFVEEVSAWIFDEEN